MEATQHPTCTISAQRFHLRLDGPLPTDVDYTVGPQQRSADRNEGWSGLSPAGPDVWTREVERVGHAITEPLGRMRPYREGIRAHDDAVFCESRTGEFGSMSAYYENGESYAGSWWDDDRMLAKVRKAVGTVGEIVR